MFNDNIKISGDNILQNLKSESDSKLELIGNVLITLKDGEGKILHQERSNTVVFIGRHRLARIIGGAAVPVGERIINTLRVSDGAVPPGGNHLNPNPSAQANTDLVGATKFTTSLDVPTFTATDTTTPAMVFSKILNATDVNMVINEAGLYFGSTGPMLARVTFSTLDLRNTTTNSVELIWRIDL